MLAVVDPLSVPEGVALGVTAAVLDAETVVDGVGVGVAPALAVELPDPLSAAVALALAPCDTVALGVSGAEGGSVGVVDGVDALVPEDDGVAVLVGVGEPVELGVGELDGVASAETVEVAEIVDEGDAVPDCGGEPLAEPPTDNVAVGVAGKDEETLVVDDQLSETEGV